MTRSSYYGVKKKENDSWLTTTVEFGSYHLFRLLSRLLLRY